MVKLVLACAALAAVCGSVWAADANEAIARELVAMERKAMDGWMAGNPDPTLSTLAPDITYIHLVTEKRLEGLPAVKALFESYRGRPLFESYEIVEPKVQVAGDVAILTYVLTMRNGGQTTRWNSTQAYQRRPEGWRVIHSHWSQVGQPAQ